MARFAVRLAGKMDRGRLFRRCGFFGGLGVHPFLRGDSGCFDGSGCGGSFRRAWGFSDFAGGSAAEVFRESIINRRRCPPFRPGGRNPQNQERAARSIFDSGPYVQERNPDLRYREDKRVGSLETGSLASGRGPSWPTRVGGVQFSRPMYFVSFGLGGRWRDTGPDRHPVSRGCASIFRRNARAPSQSSGFRRVAPRKGSPRLLRGITNQGFRRFPGVAASRAPAACYSRKKRATRGAGASSRRRKAAGSVPRRD